MQISLISRNAAFCPQRESCSSSGSSRSLDYCVLHYKQTVLNTWRKHPALRSINKTVILVLTPKLIPYSSYGVCWGKEEEEPRPETANIHSLLPPCSPGKPGAHAWLSLCLGEEAVCSPAALQVRLWWGRQVWHPITSDMAICSTCCRWARGGCGNEDMLMVFQNCSEMSALCFLPT